MHAITVKNAINLKKNKDRYRGGVAGRKGKETFYN